MELRHHGDATARPPHRSSPPRAPSTCWTTSPPNGPGTQLQLSNRLGIPKSSLHALLRTMTDARLAPDRPDRQRLPARRSTRSSVSSAYLDGDPVLVARQRRAWTRSRPPRRRPSTSAASTATTSSTPPSASPCTRCACTPPSAAASRRTPRPSAGRSWPSSPRTSATRWCPTRSSRITAHTIDRPGRGAGDHRRRGPRLGYAAESEESCLGRALLRRRAAVRPPGRRRAQRRRADQPPGRRPRGLHHRDAAQREGPPVRGPRGQPRPLSARWPSPRNAHELGARTLSARFV